MTKEEQKYFIKTLLYISNIDNNISEEELNYFNSLEDKFELTSDEFKELYNEVTNNEESIEDVLLNIKDNDTKDKLMYELLYLCYIDNDFSLDERNGINDISILLNYDLSRINKIEKKVKADLAKEKIKTVGKEAGDKTIKGFMHAFDKSKKGVINTGKAIADGSNIAAHKVAEGLGVVSTKITFTFESLKKTKEANKELRKRLQKDNITEAVKQKVIMNLHEKIKLLTKQLKEEKERNDRNEEMIRLLQAQIEDFEATMKVAENVKTA